MTKNLRKADLESILAKVENDFKLLEKHMLVDNNEAEEHALDMKYLRDRQLFLGAVR